MAVRWLRFVSLFLTAIAMGLTFCHVAEIWGKLRLDPGTWITIQQNLYVAFAPLGAVAEIGAIVCSLALVVAVRRRPTSFKLTIGGAACNAAGLASWFALVAPVNEVIAAAVPPDPPPAWAGVRSAWETGHAVGAALFTLAFALLLWSILVDTPPAARSSHPASR
jgi:hypothetical protein